MKIVLVLDRFDVAGGGLERWTIGFADFLARRGHCVHVVAFAAAEATLPVTIHLLPPVRGLLGRAAAIAAFLRGFGADVVLDTGTSWAGDVFLPCTGSRRYSQARLVATEPPLRRLRAALSPKSRWRDVELGVLERRQVRRARHVVAVSAAVRDLLMAQHGIGADRITVIPNGVDTGRFARERLRPLRGAARAALGADAATVFLGSAHNMRLKGMDTAIRAMARLVAEGADALLVIAGGQPDRTWTGLAAQASGRVRFMGLVEDMSALVAAADALVHPTRWDACSLSTIEAGAAGLPVITTARNGASELIRDGETGFVLADPEDVAALAERMRRLLDPALRARMGAAAAQAARTHDVQDNYAAVEAVLLANRRDRSAPAASP